MKYLEFYPEWVAITAVALLIKHLIYPYHYREKFPYDDPPPKILGPFSLGEFVQYIIQVLTLPLIGFAMLLFNFSGKAKDAAIMAFILIWWFIPKKLARKIDGW